METIEEASSDGVFDMTADIVATYVSNNHIQVTELPALIAGVHTALLGLGNGTAAEPVGPEKAT